MRRFWRLLIEEHIPFEDGTVRGDADIGRSRAIAAATFLRSDCDVLISIDSDIWFRPEDALALCRKAMEHDIVGAMYVTRNANPQPAVLLPDKPIVFSANSPLTEAIYLSGGFIAVRRRVFEALQATLPECHKTWVVDGRSASFWPFYMPYYIPWPEDGHLYLAEDWAFCQRAKDAGYKLWLDPSIRLGHVGDYMYTAEDLIRPPRPEPQPLRIHRNAQGALAVDRFPRQAWSNKL